MEAWQAEAQYRNSLERKRAPRCAGCGREITTELCYRLEDFNITGFACEDCIRAARAWTFEMEF